MMFEKDEAINPDATILQQLDGQMEKVITIALWKLLNSGSVMITAEDIEKISEAFAPSIPTLAVMGHFDRIELRVIDENSAQRLAEHDKATRGNA